MIVVIKTFVSGVRNFGFDAIENRVLSLGVYNLNLILQCRLRYELELKRAAIMPRQQKRFTYIGYVRFHRLLQRRSRSLPIGIDVCSFSDIVGNFVTQRFRFIRWPNNCTGKCVMERVPATEHTFFMS